MKKQTGLRIALASLALWCSGSCIAATAAGIGVVSSEAFLDGAHTLYVEQDVDVAWEATRHVVTALDAGHREIDEASRAILVFAEGINVAARVVSRGPGASRIAVTAERLGFEDKVYAQEVLAKIDEEIAARAK